MEVTEKKIKVARLVDALKSGNLLRNPEYQRGEAWKETQKAGFVDSLFRAYPVPALFLRVVEQGKTLDDAPARSYEIVDGQQRLIALQNFKDGRVRLMDLGEDSKLRLPRSVRQRPAPWAGKLYSELSDSLKTQFDDFQITVFEIGKSAGDDEVRDLFIRLQSGTALTRQQIRDAWPGNLGPFIESIAGKLDRQPSQRLFELVDKRGQRLEDDERDEYVGDRQFAAQLLKVFLVRERDPGAYSSVTANELDSLYHEQTDWEANGPTALRFVSCLNLTAQVFEHLRKQQPQVKKFKRHDVATVIMYLQDITRSPNTKIDRKFIEATAAVFESDTKDKPAGGRSMSPGLLKRNYEWWRTFSPESKLIRLDSRRAFDEQQQKEIWKRANGKCGVCGDPADNGDCEYDHFPIPYRDGGPTETTNGRLVHFGCHPRGRPVADE